MVDVEFASPFYPALDGRPLQLGSIYYGASGQNPVTNPVTVYWDADGTQPAAQPISVVNGVPARNGSPARIYVNGDYSKLVLDSLGRQISYEASHSARNLDTIVFTQSGVGAGPRSTQVKLREQWVSVTDFLCDDGVMVGAVDGHDDTSGIRKAITAAAGKSLFFPPGFTYTVKDATNTSSALVLTALSNQSWFSVGPGATIKLGAHTTQGHRLLTASGVSNFSLHNLIFDGNKAQQTGASDEQSHCVIVLDGTNIAIENCSLTNAQGDGLYVGGTTSTGSANVQVIGNTFNANVRQAISLVKGENIRISSNDIAGTTGGAPGAGIDIEANLAGDNLRLITIADNNIRNNNWGVFVNEVAPARQLTITGNTFSGQRAADIICRGEGVTISSNVFYPVGRGAMTNYAAIELMDTKQVSITANTIVGNYDINERGGIRVNRGCRQVSIVGNTIKKTFGAGIQVYTGLPNGTGNTQSVSVIGNSLEDCQPTSGTGGAMAIGSLTAGTGADLLDVIVSNNTILDTRTGGQQAALGIQLINASATLLKTWNIVNNDISGPTAQITDVSGWDFLGSLVTVRTNLDFDLTASVSQDKTVTAPGAVLGVPVMLGVPNGSVTADTLFWAWVSATDTITVRAMRIAGTPNPATGAFFLTYAKLLTH